MNKLDKLQNILQNDEHVRRFKELEKLVDQNKDLQQKYKVLLDAQKIMVQREVKKHPKYEEAKTHYETLKSELLEFVVMEEYLDLLELLNNDISLIQSIIEQEIEKDFD